MSIRVVQWTTGNVGRRSVRAVVTRPDLELVGCYAWSPDKVGRDVGELCGIEPVGVAATNDVDALLALRPDCVVYNPMWQDVDELVRILEAGVNVVSTAAFINGTNLGAGRDRIADACARGGSTMFGTGVSPGFVELLGIVIAGVCDRVDKVTIGEAADTTLYDSPDTELLAGFARPIDDPALPAMTAEGTAIFGEAVAMVADALGVELDEIVCEAEYAQTTEDLDLGSWTIKAGCVAGLAASWQGRVGNRT
ncbi:MAG TPA: dihydrodipicolinate reductase, partial [Acidimicrobiia bacterium]